MMHAPVCWSWVWVGLVGFCSSDSDGGDDDRTHACTVSWGSRREKSAAGGFLYANAGNVVRVLIRGKRVRRVLISS